MSNFSDMLKEAFKQPQKDIDAFFEEHYMVPLNSQLDGNPTVPAETIRNKRQQTNTIKNHLLTFAKK